MTPSYVWMLAFLAAVWGASYLFVKVAVDEIEPAAMMFIRLVIAATLLVPFVLVREGTRDGVRELARAWRPGAPAGHRKRGRAVHADRLGREVHRLGSCGDRERDRAAVRGPASDSLPAERARTYLLPVTAVLYGVLLLDERLTAGTLAGLALILPGVALGSGALRWPRREPAAASPST